MPEKHFYTVIVADDEDELRESVTMMIPWEALGFRLLGSAGNGLDALQLVEQLQPDLLLTDIRMPFISGIELARQVREIRPAMHIAFLSGYDDFEYAKQAIQYNIISYMLKPLTLDGLAAELKNIHSKIDKQYDNLRRHEMPRADRTAFAIPLLLEPYSYLPLPPGYEERLRTEACRCGLLRGMDDPARYVVLAASLFDADGSNVTDSDFVRMVAQVANKYLRNFVFLANGRVNALLMGNPSDFEEYLHILGDEICQVAERVLDRRANVGVSRDTMLLGDLNTCYRKALEALRTTEEGEGGVHFIGDLRKGGSTLCERALDAIDRHYMDEDLSLVSLGTMLEVSPNHLSACIKKTTGETFINILIRKRMEAARELLLQTPLKVQEVARRCGYVDQHYFSYCFKKYCGTSPNALRRQNQDKTGDTV